MRPLATQASPIGKSIHSATMLSSTDTVPPGFPSRDDRDSGITRTPESRRPTDRGQPVGRATIPLLTADRYTALGPALHDEPVAVVRVQAADVADAVDRAVRPDRDLIVAAAEQQPRAAVCGTGLPDEADRRATRDEPSTHMGIDQRAIGRARGGHAHDEPRMHANVARVRGRGSMGRRHRRTRCAPVPRSAAAATPGMCRSRG